MNSSIRVAALALLALVASGQADATTFQNAYVEFELPDEWTCARDETEWVCSDEREGRQRTAIIVLAAKVPGADDRLDRYEDHLATTHPVTDVDGNPLGRSTRVEFVKREKIGDRVWVWARHYESEVPNYYTDYLASTDDEIAVLVTFSSHRDSFNRAFERFFPSITSIRPRKP